SSQVVLIRLADKVRVVFGAVGEGIRGVEQVARNDRRYIEHVNIAGAIAEPDVSVSAGRDATVALAIIWNGIFSHHAVDGDSADVWTDPVFPDCHRLREPERAVRSGSDEGRRAALGDAD